MRKRENEKNNKKYIFLRKRDTVHYKKYRCGFNTHAVFIYVLVLTSTQVWISKTSGWTLYQHHHSVDLKSMVLHPHHIGVNININTERII